MGPATGAADTGAADTRAADTLAVVGEVAALARIFPRLPNADAALIGPGDDAAVVAAPDGRFVVTTDTMIHGPDFRLAWSTPHDLGWKAAVTNLSDVAAMGATPSALVVAIAAPLDTPVALLEGIADGLRDACAAMSPGTGVVGGDLSVSNTLVLAVTAFGDLGGRSPVLRSGARPGDRVAVAGALGLAGAGIARLFAAAQSDQGTAETEPVAEQPVAKRPVADQPVAEQPVVERPGGARHPDAALGRAVRAAHPAIVEAQLAPVSPLGAGRSAAEAGATAMLDVSDGLVLDAGRIALSSGCSLELFHDAIEAEGRALRELDSTIGAEAEDFVLCGGEDHALLATFPPGAELPAEFRVIGEVRAGQDGHPLVTIGGRPYVRPGGWDPFDDWNGAVG
ncbi:thiamine-phosphate kinase [Subtercola boreus]|uniref:Thiamine-monophosphate kinase n=1 Tax=Subtercola boreus TaxID=120213 RepID=A0A3E0VN42_9MICO|nr:thiamine-phosphate kinase [Subtercola boreus]